ncbi:MAG: GNAT family N-acetyltransferase [Rubrobacteraceae bacterium]
MKVSETSLYLSILNERLAVCRFDAASNISAWEASSGFLSLTRTADELSVVCPERSVPENVACEPGWRALKLEGPLDFSLIGVLARITDALAGANVSVFVVSTYDTDYILVKEGSLQTAKIALQKAGYGIKSPGGIEKSFTIRSATEEDKPFLWEMLTEAAQRPAVRDVMENPGTARYVEGWMDEKDLGLIAMATDGHPVGAAWVRLLTGENRGYGYVDDETPELAIAVRPEFRGIGVGALLLAQLVEEAGRMYSTICLSVRTDNPAFHLYERMGFQIVHGSERTNSVNGVSITMKRNLAEPN